MIARRHALLNIERQIELAGAIEEWHPQLTEHPYTFALGWKPELGIGIDVRYRALAICEVDECKQIGLRADEPRKPWSIDDILDQLVADGRLPFNGVVFSIAQVKTSAWWPYNLRAERPQLLVRYHQPLRRR